ncbi:MAG: RNA polymerase sigma factor [Acidobacteriota bacterium]
MEEPPAEFWCLALPDDDPASKSGHSEPLSPIHLVEAAYESHAELLFRLAMAECRNREVARDAVQEAFLRYHEAASAGQAIRHVRAWLARVVINQVRDDARRSLRQENLSAVRDSASGWVESDSGGELMERIQELLSPREFECVRLRILGYKYFEIAEILSISAGSVACLLSRALRKLEVLRNER